MNRGDMMEGRSLGQRAPVLWLLVPLMTGIAIGRLLPSGAGGGWWLAGALAGLAGAASAARFTGPVGRLFWGAGTTAAIGCASVAYLQVREHRLAVWDHLPAREAELELRIEQVFPAAEGRATVNGFARIESAPVLLAETAGQRLYFSLRPTPGLPGPIRSARWRATGVLEPLPRRPGAGFTTFAATNGAAFQLTRGRLQAEVQRASTFFRFCARAAERFDRILGAGLRDQPALRAIHVSIMLGRKTDLSEEQRTTFLQSGTIHLFAISGLHIGVMWTAIAGVFALVRMPRSVIVALGLTLLFLYVEITGGSLSAMRAFLMIAFVLVGEVLRWPRNPLAGIAASALVVLLWDPFQLLGASFQLSYAVVAALLLYGLPLEEHGQRRWLPWRDKPEPDWRWWHKAGRGVGREVITGVALSLAATIASLPTNIELFQLFTPGAPLTNLVLVPTLSLAIVAGTLSLLVGLLGLMPVSVFFNHASIVLIWSMEHGIATCLRLPGMFWHAEFRAAWLSPVSLVVLLAAMLLGYSMRWRRRVGGLWLPVVLLCLILVTAVRLAPLPSSTPARNLPASPRPVIGTRQ